MGRPIPSASDLFLRMWAEIERIRRGMGLTQEAVAHKCGFKKSTWHVYKKRGTIPFHLLEHVVHVLNAKLQAQVITQVPAGGAVNRSTAAEEGDPMADYDYAIRLARLFDHVPDDQKEAAFGAAYTAARNAIRDLPFEEPAAEHKADRGRRK